MLKNKEDTMFKRRFSEKESDGMGILVMFAFFMFFVIPYILDLFMRG